MNEIKINDGVKWGPHTGIVMGEVSISNVKHFAVKCNTMSCKDENYTYDTFLIKEYILKKIVPPEITDFRVGDIFQWNDLSGFNKAYIFEVITVENYKMYGFGFIECSAVHDLYRKNVYTKEQLLAVLNMNKAIKEIK